ncbi:MAG: hypothetical protein K6G46_04910 [Prevotella sp.]|nr:hypothetical protein [Prevotella sp.]
MSCKSEEEIEKAKAESLNMLKALYQQIVKLSEDVVPLYDDIENYFFQEVDYQVLKSVICQWMTDAGRSPESGMDKDTYEKLRKVYNDPLSNRIIHWADVQMILAAFQDRVMAVRNYFMEIYRHLPAYCLYEDDEYSASQRMLNDESDSIHTAINNVFVSLCSSFDLLTKVVYECSHYDKDSFAEYKKLICRKENILYKKGNYGFDGLKAFGLLYSDPVCVRTACSFRDEFIHNGAWDYRCAIYYPSIDGEPVEPFVVMPDVDVNGNLVTSGSRNKFYARSDKLNVVLPRLVKEIVEVLSKTVAALRGVLQARIKPMDKDKATEEGLFTLTKNQVMSYKALLGDKFTNNELIETIDYLMPQFPMSSPIIAELCNGISLTQGLGELLLYAGCEKGRPYRILMFVLLLNETANLKTDYKLAYHLLKEAYIMTDNIYGQLKGSTYQFCLSDYLTELEVALPNRNPNELEAEEAELYNGLPQTITVYRGMCNEEKESGNYGISWTLDADYALNYVFYKKNEVEGAVGWRAEMEIDKKDIFAVWGVKGKRKEIVINPNKCKDVGYTKVVK